MMLWKISPVAPRASSQWQDRPIWDEVIVRASSAAQARVLAAAMERRELGHQVPIGNESHSFWSGFKSEKLYWVRRLRPEEEPALDPEGLPEVLRAAGPGSVDQLGRLL